MRFLKAVLILALFIFGLLFFTQNEEILATPLTLQLDLYVEGYAWSGLSIPFFFVVLLAFAAGALFTILYFFLDKIKTSFDLMARKRKIRSLERELARAKEKAKVLEAMPALETAKEAE